jgi:hypothetical protein
MLIMHTKINNNGNCPAYGLFQAQICASSAHVHKYTPLRFSLCTRNPLIIWTVVRRPGSFLLSGEAQFKPLPNLAEGTNQLVNHLFRMGRGDSDAQALVPHGDCWVIDGLDVDSIILEKLIGYLATPKGITNHNGYDVALANYTR